MRLSGDAIGFPWSWPGEARPSASRDPGRRAGMAGPGPAMTRGGAVRRSLALAAALCGLAGAAEARPARCSTSGEGDYACNFVATGRDGSFEIAAPGKPTYRLDMMESGVATGFVNVGGRSVALPGRFLRSRSDPACWVNDATGTIICAH